MPRTLDMLDRVTFVVSLALLGNGLAGNRLTEDTTTYTYDVNGSGGNTPRLVQIEPAPELLAGPGLRSGTQTRHRAPALKSTQG